MGGVGRGGVGRGGVGRGGVGRGGSIEKALGTSLGSYLHGVHCIAKCSSALMLTLDLGCFGIHISHIALYWLTRYQAVTTQGFLLFVE